VTAAPRVSVLMPVRDAELYVATAVRSVLSQTLSDLELVIVDDGSTDSTRTVVDELGRSDERIRVMDGRGGGVTGALEQAAAAARGCLLARMDADDECRPARLQRQVELLDAEPAVAVVGSAVEMMTASGRTFAEHRFPCRPVDVRKAMERANCVAHPSVVMRRSAFEQVGGYRSVFPAAQDYDLWLRILDRWEIANLEETLLRYRVHPRQLGIADIERQTYAAMAAQLASRLRREAGDDSEAVSSAPGRELLLRCGLSERQLGRQLARNVAGQAALLRRAGLPDVALSLVDGLLRRRRLLNVPRSEVAALAWVRGGCQWDRRRVGAALSSALAATLMRPSLALRAARKLVRLRRPPLAEFEPWRDPGG
jgi:hypothetical protein